MIKNDSGTFTITTRYLKSVPDCIVEGYQSLIPGINLPYENELA